MRLLALTLLIAALPLSAQNTGGVHATHTKPIAVVEPAGPLAPLNFLLGTWSATTGAGTAGAKSIGTYTFAPDLGGHVLSRTSSTDSCTGPAAFNCQHHDQLTIFPEGTALAALYLDSEGHVIHYGITTPDAHTAIFLSTDPGPHFRLTYHLEGTVMTGKFQFAPPGSTDFHSYLEWSGIRQ
jgi:hypothetical protein